MTEYHSDALGIPQGSGFFSPHPDPKSRGFRMRTNYRYLYVYGLFVLSLIPLVLAPYYNWNFRNPVNFIPYVFSAIILENNFADNKKYKLTIMMMVIFVVLSILDWVSMDYYAMNRKGGPLLPYYSRISLVFGAMFWTYMPSSIKFKPRKVISLLSSYSLGIFCLHRTVPLMFLLIIRKVFPGLPVEIITKNMNTTNYLPFLFAVISTVFVVYLLKRTIFFKRFV